MLASEDKEALEEADASTAFCFTIPGIGPRTASELVIGINIFFITTTLPPIAALALMSDPGRATGGFAHILMQLLVRSENRFTTALGISRARKRLKRDYAGQGPVPA